MIPPTGPFPREARVRRSNEFSEIAAKGRRYVSESFVLIVGPTTRGETGRARIGITVSGKVGNAVVRNRLKRRIREWFRRAGWVLVPGRDTVVIVRPSAAELDGRTLFQELIRVAKGVR